MRSNSIRFGISLVCDDIVAYPSWVKTVEQSGYSMIGLTDSPALYHDTYVTGALCALNTTTARFGPRVTNPLTRHPIVTACAIASLNELSGGRAILGIGVGDSAAHTAGRRPATLAELEQYVRDIRNLWSGDGYVAKGQRVSIPWAAHNGAPIYIAAAGPRALELAGRIGDGVIVGSGLLPDVIENSIAHIRRGAEAAGRDWQSLDLWWTCGCRIDSDRAIAEERLLSLAAAMLNSQFQISLEGKLLPEGLRDDVSVLVKHYAFDDHVKPAANASNARLLSSLPRLRAYALSRYTVAGTAEQCLEQIVSASDAGARQIWLTAPFADRLEFIATFGSEILNKLAAD